MLRARVDSPSEGETRIISSKLNGLLGKIEEIETLEKAVKAQSDRIDWIMNLEKSLNVPLPVVDWAMREFNEMVNSQLDGKIRLGVYQAVPQRLELEGQIILSKIDSLSQEDKEQLIEFGKTLYGIIDMARSPKGGYEMKKGNGEAKENERE